MQIEKNSSRKNKAEFWECECKKCNKIFHTASQNIKKIKSCGCSKQNSKNRKFIVGYVGQTNNGDKYQVVDYLKELVTIKFLDTGYTITVNNAKLSIGCIKDKLKPSVCGVGYLGYCDEINRSKEYTLWKGIIERCYNTKRKDYQKYGNKGVTVCDRWKCFAYFLEDIKYIEGYDKEKFYKNKLDLDKDIKQIGIPINQKVYSLETCVFVDKHINRSITTRTPTKNVSIESIKGDYVLKTNCPVEELAKQINVKTQYITRILRGEAKTHNGWTFRYFK